MVDWDYEASRCAIGTGVGQMHPNEMTQTAPYPEVLARVVEKATFKPGWAFSLNNIDRGQGSEGLTLSIYVSGPDSSNHGAITRVVHYMIVPAASYDERAWVRWLFDQCLLVEQHEACEFFKIDGNRPYAPNHGPGRNPYSIIEKGTVEDARTKSDGSK